MVRSSIFTSTLLRRKIVLLPRRYESFGLHQPLPWFVLLISSHDFIWFCINGDMAPCMEPFRKAFFLRLQSFKNVFSDFPGGTVDRNLPANVGTQVQSLVQEDSTCHTAIEPMHHNYWAYILHPVLCNKRSHLNEKPTHCNEE